MTQSRAWFLVLLTIFFWGSNCNAVNNVVLEATPLTGSAERFGFAFILFLAARLFTPAESNLKVKDILWLIALGVMGVFGYNFCFFSANETTNALNAALIMALSPALTLVLSVFLLKQKIYLLQIVGVLIAFAGVGFIVTQGNFSHLQFVRGDLLMLVACLLWSCYTVFSKKYLAQVPAIQLARWTVCTGTLVLAIAAIIFENPVGNLKSLSITTHGLLAYMGIFGSYLAYMFWLGGVKTLGAEKTALTLNLMPLVTLLINLAMGTLPTSAQLIGCVLVIAGILIALNVGKNNWANFLGQKKSAAE